MNKLILAISLLLSLNSFGAALLNSCENGDTTCEMKTVSPSVTEANALAKGISCEACHAYEQAQNALLSNTVGNFSGASGTTTPTSPGSDTSTSVNRRQ
jgi:hypothetical protein